MKLIDSKLCCECDELTDVHTKACPSCTCTHFIVLSRIIKPLAPREESELVRKIAQTSMERRCALKG